MRTSWRAWCGMGLALTLGCTPASGRERAPGAASGKATATAAPSASASAQAHGSPAHHTPQESQDAAAAALALIRRDNGWFVEKRDKAHFERFQTSQHPRVTVIGCSDSRFHMQALEQAPDDELFVIRNIGNNVHATAGSIDYGIRHLHTPILLIVGHVGCGAVKAAMGDYDSESAVIQRELDALHLSLFRTAAVGTFQQRWLANVFGNVHQQVRYALNDYRARVDDGSLFVVGAVYDFRNELGEGYGRLHIVNVNGEKDQTKIAELPLMNGSVE